MSAFVAGLFLAEASWATQLTLAVLQGVFWHHALNFIAFRVARPYCARQPWLPAFTARSHETWTKGYGIPFTEHTESFDFSCYIMATIALHFCGGLLSTPALLKPGPAATALALHGALCEVGFDLADGFTRLKQALGYEGQAGRDKQPPVILVLSALHHLMGLSMVLPMNLSPFRDDPNYHELIFLLQSVAFIALATQFYSYTLDVARPADLLRMRVSVAFTFAAILYSRGVRFAVVGARLLDGFEGRMFAGACVALGSMALFNLVVILDCAAKFSKFCLGKPKAA